MVEDLTEGDAVERGAKEIKLALAIASFYKKEPQVEAETKVIRAGRGRQKLDESAASEPEPDLHIMMQLRKVVSLRGLKPVIFRNGEKKTINVSHARRALAMHDSHKSSIEKGRLMTRLGKSHKEFLHAIGA